jgi:hypothetical protein
MRVQLRRASMRNFFSICDDAQPKVALPRRAFLTGLIGLIAAPAIVRIENLMPIVAWEPRVEWRGYDLVCNGALVSVCDFPELFAALRHTPSPSGTFRLPDYPNSVVRAIPAGLYPVGAMASFDPSIVGPTPPGLPVEEISARLVGPLRRAPP